MRTMKKIVAVVLAVSLCGFCAPDAVYAEGYKDFSKAFNYASSSPSSVHVFKQTVEVHGNELANAHARCTQYTYKGDQPTLVVDSISSAFPTNSVSFTSTSSGRAMKYTDAIPLENSIITFQGSVSGVDVTHSGEFTIAAAVQG